PYLSALVLLYSTVTAAGPYRVPAVLVEARVAYTNNPPTSAMRGFGAMQTVFAYESQIDRIAKALGSLDPVEVRRVNALRRGDSLPVGQVIETHVALPELAERAWAALGPPTAPRAPHLRVGRGLACNFQPYGRIVWLHDWSSAWVGFEMDGSLVVRCGVPDVGGGQASSLGQIAAEVLGVDFDRVSLHIADSALTPLAGTTTASRQLYMSGNAVLKAARERAPGAGAGVGQGLGGLRLRRPRGRGRGGSGDRRAARAEVRGGARRRPREQPRVGGRPEAGGRGAGARLRAHGRSNRGGRH